MAKERVAELLADLVDKVAEELQQKGIDKTTAEEIGNSVARRIASEWGGCNLYIPRGLLWGIDERDLEIFDKFDGSNHFELAKEYGLSVQWIYRLVERVRTAKIRESQSDLFGDDVQ